MAGAQGIATLNFSAGAKAARYRAVQVVTDSNPTNVDWSLPGGGLPAGTSSVWIDLAYGGGIWVACTFSDNAAMSSDGVSWSAITLPLQRIWASIAYGNGLFAAVSSLGQCAVSANGTSWNWYSMPAGGYIGVCFGAGRFVAVSDTGSNAGYSTDGQTWVSATMPSSANWSRPVYGDGGFVSLQGSSVARSSDGSTWSIVATLPVSAGWYSTAFGNGTYVSVSTTAAVYSKDGGITWQLGVLQSLPSAVNSIAFGGGRFLAVTDNNRVLASIDGVTWDFIGQPLQSPNNLVVARYGNGMFIATCNGSNAFAYLKKNTRTISTVNVQESPALPSPGSNIATATVTGQTGLLPTHAIDAWVQGDSTADHSAYEHTTLPVKVAVTNVVSGVGFDITAYSDLRLKGDFKVRWVWTDNAKTGSATINFGTGFGSDAATVTVTGLTTLSAGSYVQAWVQGSDSTADNTAYEHAYIPIRLRVTDKVAGVGFTIRAQSDFRLTGGFKVRYAFTP